MTDLMYVGVDPAPSKQAAIVYSVGEGAPERLDVAAGELRDWLEAERAAHPRVLIAWDAPISFDPSLGYSDRPVDRGTRAFLGEQVKAGLIAAGAVSALPFSGCPHWAVTCDALGRPFGRREAYAMPQSHKDLSAGGPFVIEVHPAVTLALWWLSDCPSPNTPFLRYKPGTGLRADAVKANLEQAAKRLLDRRQLSWTFVESDDALDASVAWFMAKEFAQGRANWVGDPQRGGYVLPDNVPAANGATTGRLRECVDEALEHWRKGK